MEYRQLYGMKERPSLLGFGCMRLPLLPGGERGDIDYDRAQTMIDEAIANGVNYFDTAYGYLAGESEIFVGKALKNTRAIRSIWRPSCRWDRSTLRARRGDFQPSV